jgi:hypothetical protein
MHRFEEALTRQAPLVVPAERVAGRNTVTPEVVTSSCHQKYAAHRVEKEVVVNVSDDSRPIVLALTAYNRTHWKVILEGSVRITKVILAGYHSQRVSGIPAGTPIETYTHDPSPCERCWQSGEYFYSYRSPPAQLKEITELEVTTFQGRYEGYEFSIFPGIKK